ncbi:protein MAIN-LIKE 1-like [Vigna radiata var. radiata]|uniref:Protein MAIN-LIKE 1-like n=1 Tax=Vigna radiata var. radiata TaxID=3916 RepID=A0A3Q0F5L0_VIGRR|nr:protein MAIN-LIKE 1-like [Vigna radiata var. radiata]
MSMIIGSIVMPDTFESMVHLMYPSLLADLQNVSNYSWASVVFSCLYRALNHGIRVDQDNIKRWYRTTQSIFHDTTTVQQFRQKMDDLSPKQFIWTPYKRDEIHQMIPVELPLTCQAIVPLICFFVVEFHQSDRVMRQFGFRQTVPQPPMSLDDIHKQDMRGRADWNWQEHHQ